MKILITGATGFIGRHLVKTLSEEGHSIRCLVRKSSNIDFLKVFGCEFFYGDLYQAGTLQGISKDIDIVYHLGGVVISRNKGDFYRTNVLGAKNLLETCKTENIKRFIYISSIAVYSPPQEHILLTEESPLDPITPYGKSKLEAERLVLQYSKQYGLPAVIIRAPLIYGPDHPEVLNNFFKSAIHKNRIVIVGDGNNYRSFCYIENFIEGLKLVMENDKAIGKTYVISDSSAYTLKEIINEIAKTIHANIKIISLPNFLSRISWALYKFFNGFFSLDLVELYVIRTLGLNLGFDISKIKSDLSFNPTYSLSEGLARTINWVKEEN
jgi:nucleoside-diphosphate-sugar epimerase